LSQIGELAGKLESDFIENTAHIPWRKIRGMRNRIVHDYEGDRERTLINDAPQNA